LVTLADKVVRASGKDLPVKVKESGLGAEYSGDNRRLLAEMPFRFRDMDESIRSLYHWYEDRKPSIDPGKLHFDA
jgi:GDP-L-fucose synthase